MKNDIIDSMGRIGSDMVEGVDAVRRNRKARSGPAWVRLGAVAACLCLVAASASAALFRQGGPAKKTADAAEDTASAVLPADVQKEEVAYGFSLEGEPGLTYYPISFAERVRFGLVPEESEGLTPENVYSITEEDLGEVMGKVAQGTDASLAGKTVYRYAEYPDSRAICILDMDGCYAFYCASWINIDMTGEKDAAKLMQDYSLPEHGKLVEVQDAEEITIFTVTDGETIGQLCALLSECENIGQEEAERRFAKAWRDAYGNDDVYYSDTDGCCRYRTVGEPEERTYTAEDGTVITELVYPDGYYDPYDTAHELWSRGERCLKIETDDGLCLFIDYYPSIGVYFSSNGQFAVPEGAGARLAALLEG